MTKPDLATPLRVLHLEDSARDADVVRHRLGAEGLSCDILLVSDQQGFETALTQHAFGLILLDYNLPGYDGISALKHAQLTRPEVPVILISGTVGDEDAVKCLHFGATDYLLKDRLDRLVPAVQRALLEAEERCARRDAEQALRNERDLAQQYLDTAQVILLKLAIDGRIALVNRYACALLGWTAEELIGRDWIDTCVPPRLREQLRNKVHEVIGGDLAINENLILTKSGQERLVEWRPKLLRDDDGNVVGLFSSGTDITDRSQAVAALRTAEERMRFALQSAKVGIWDMDYTTGVLAWSETLEDQYGVPRGTFGGTFEDFVERVHPEDREQLLDTVGTAMRRAPTSRLRTDRSGPTAPCGGSAARAACHLGRAWQPGAASASRWM